MADMVGFKELQELINAVIFDNNCPFGAKATELVVQG